MFIGLLGNVVYASNYTKCISLKNYQCMIQPTLVYFHPNEYGHELCYHSFAVNLDGCVESCNTLNDLSNRLCVPDKAENLKFNVLI